MPTANPGNAAYDAVRELNEARAETVHELLHLTDEDCTAPATWANIIRNVNFLLRAYSLHDLDHLQHLQKLLRARGWQPTEAQILLAKAQALRAETETLLMSLPDDLFNATGPEEDAWSARRVLEHMREVDASYLASIRAGLGQRHVEENVTAS